MKTLGIRLLLIAALLVAVCSAGVIAAVPVGGLIVVDSRPYMVGWQFSVSSPFVVDGLAYFDNGDDGLGEAHDVGIFDSATGTLLVSATVPSGTGATLDPHGFRVVPVSYALGVGTYVIGGQQSSDADYVRFQATSVVSIPGVTYLEERELETSSFVMPTSHWPENEMGMFGPNFTVAAIPEPGSFMLVGLAGLALGLLRRIRR